MRGLALIGMPLSGKTTAGLMLVGLTGRAFIDTDEFIEQTAGKSVGSIFAEFGEAAFRGMESSALARLEHEGAFDDSVISTGGGLILREHNRLILRRNCFVVYLYAAPDILAARSISAGDTRPLLRTENAVAKLYAERANAYDSACDFKIDCGTLAPEEVAGKVLTVLYGNACDGVV